MGRVAGATPTWLSPMLMLLGLRPWQIGPMSGLAVVSRRGWLACGPRRWRGRSSKRGSVKAFAPFCKARHCLNSLLGAARKGCKVELEQGAGPRQYGAGRQGGAALEIAEIRAAAAMRPECALIGLDEQNAFGELDWTDALRQAQRYAPAFAVPLSMLWRGGGGIIVHVLRPDGTWGFFTIYGGVVQGSQEGSLVFCLVIGQVLRRVLADARLAGAKMLHWLYIDDWIVQLPLDKAITLLDAAEESSAESSLRLQRRKCLPRACPRQCPS